METLKTNHTYTEDEIRDFFDLKTGDAFGYGDEIVTVRSFDIQYRNALGKIDTEASLNRLSDAIKRLEDILARDKGNYPGYIIQCKVNSLVFGNFHISDFPNNLPSEYLRSINENARRVNQ